MNSFKTTTLAVLLTGAANAGEVLVTSDIAVSETWTADNTYNLQDQIYVLPGATLTIEAGVVVASDTGLGGSLAVTKGAQVIVQGTADAPVIMTSKADVATWTPDGSHPTGGDPTTGSWREAVNEWGNLTLMGAGYISEDATTGNVPTPSASNVAAMEGLVESFPGDPRVLYGGGDDDDDSGSISYLSLRYGGRVIGLNNELNGLSLGGIGRGTDIHHYEIMNNVDDGTEIWGGCVNIKHFSIWNIGDDTFDVDQGWRGKVQFGLIVQGHSADASQGSGVGDNCFETDGAEDSDWQPVTSSVIYNCTVIGQPVDGDGLTAWRDNARVQYRNCIFMDCGERVVRFDNVDGDGANGYGHNGTTSWADTWTTDWDQYSTVNAPANPGAFYHAHTDGKLASITDSVFFRNLKTDAYTEATARGVFDAGNNNVLTPGFDAADAPIQDIQRGPAVVKGGKTMLPVTFLDARPKNAALTSVDTAPSDGFFTNAKYRGAFAPDVAMWTCGWTASDAFGFTGGNCIGTTYCEAIANSSLLAGSITAYGSDVLADNDVSLFADQLPNNKFGMLVIARTQGNVIPPGATGRLCVGPGGIARLTNSIQSTGNHGTLSFSPDLTNLPVIIGTVNTGDTLNFQFWFRDTGSTSNFSNATSITFN